MYRFLVTASILVLLGFIYLGQRLVAEIWPANLRVALWLLLAAMIANLLWLPFKRWRRQASKPTPGNETIARVLESSAYNLMGYLSLLLLFSAASEVARIVFKIIPKSLQGDILVQIPAGQDLDSMLAITIAALATLFFAWGRFAVVRGPRYTFVNAVFPLQGKARRRPRFRGKKTATRKIRIAQVSDLHIGRAIKKPYVTRVVEMLNAQNADIVCFTGDIGDGNIDHLYEDAAPLAGIQSKYGTYYIPGNHEYYWGMQKWLGAFTLHGFKPVINRGEVIKTDAGSVFLAGVSDPTAARFAEDLPKIPDTQPADISILLAHQPIFARSAAQKKYDLMLSGHTHGGQYIPWAWVVHLVYRFASGLYRSGKMLVYVNDGTGYWGAPVRLGTRLEITILDIYLNDENA
jgi:uncharacterized protein